MAQHRDLIDYYNDDYLLLSDVMTPQALTENEVEYMVRLLEMTAGCRLLDLGCGYGRIAHELARLGIRVTGVDLVPQMLDFARRRAADEGLEINYVEGDIESLTYKGAYDVAIMWFYAFGYGADSSHQKILRRICSALRPGGTLLFDQYNTHRLAREEHPSLIDRGDTLFIHRPRPDLEHGRWGAERIVVTEGRIRRSHFSCRSYTPPELRVMLEAAGFRAIRFLGDGMQPYGPASAKLVIAAMKQR